MNNLLDTAYEKELYTRWLTLYPYMEIGHIDYMSFEEYKNKAFGNATGITQNQKQLSNDQIENEMMQLVEFYEKSQKAGGKRDGGI